MFFTQRTLNRAANLIEERGWHNGTDYMGRYCAVEAIFVAASSEAARVRALRRLRRRIGTDDIIAWNDANTREGVLAALRGRA